jgi:hypothetical protein
VQYSGSGYGLRIFCYVKRRGRGCCNGQINKPFGRDGVRNVKARDRFHEIPLADSFAAFRASPDVPRQEPRFRARDRSSWAETTPSIAESQSEIATEDTPPIAIVEPPSESVVPDDEAPIAPSLSNPAPGGSEGGMRTGPQVDPDGYARLEPRGAGLVFADNARTQPQPTASPGLEDKDGYLQLVPHGAGLGAADSAGHVRSLSEGMEQLSLTAPAKVLPDQVYVYDSEQDIIYTYMEPAGAGLAPVRDTLGSHGTDAAGAASPGLVRNNSRRNMQRNGGRSPSPQRAAVSNVHQVCVCVLNNCVTHTSDDYQACSTHFMDLLLRPLLVEHCISAPLAHRRRTTCISASCGSCRTESLRSTLSRPRRRTSTLTSWARRQSPNRAPGPCCRTR